MSRNPLPIDEVLPQILDALQQHNAVVLRAATGAGKTTRVPQALYHAQAKHPEQGSTGQIIMVEPRRIAAKAAARRIAQEMGVKLGREVGYRVRFDNKSSEATKILVVTEGILLRMLQADPFLEKAGALLFDEFHERRLDADLALALARQLQQELRPSLQLVVMSATLDMAPIAVFLGNCPCVTSTGRSYPIDQRYLDAPDDRRLHHQVRDAVRQMLPAHEGDILVFLPGVGEIRQSQEALADLAETHDFAILPLYGNLSPEEQDRVLRPLTQRKVVLATNVAESSLTIDGVSIVIDSGLARVMRYDTACALNRLELTRIDKQAADQRAGRAGRQGPGLCLRLWTVHDQRTMRDFEEPEIQRVDISSALLQLYTWGESQPTQFGWFEPPTSERLKNANTLLHTIDALQNGQLTKIGRQMALFPVQPRLARLLLAGHAHQCIAQATLVGALLSERPPFRLRPAHEQSPDDVDLSHRLTQLQRFAQNPQDSAHDLLTGPARQVLRIQRQLRQLCERYLAPEHRESTPPPPQQDRLLQALLTAFPDRVALRRHRSAKAKHEERHTDERARMVGGRGLRLPTAQSLHGAPLFLALVLDAGQRGQHADALVRFAWPLDLEQLPKKKVDDVVEVTFDSAKERVMTWQQRRYFDLVLTQKPGPKPDPQRAAEVLAQAACSQLDCALPLQRDETQQFLHRLRCLAAALPKENLPTFDDTALQDLLPALCIGKRSFGELRAIPLHQWLHDQLPYAQQQLLRHEAPERIEVPSGSHIRLQYQAPPKAPILAARIQEMFGLADTPTIARDRVAVLLHLLAPNMRPQQVTQDLRSFWDQTYPEVRKELRQRYPKHAWPEDPWNAQAQRRPSRRKK